MTLSRHLLKNIFTPCGFILLECYSIPSFDLIFKAMPFKKPLWSFLSSIFEMDGSVTAYGYHGASSHGLSYHPCQGASELLDIIAIRLAGLEKSQYGLDLIPAVTCTVPATCMFITWTTFIILSWSFLKALLKSDVLCEIRSDHQ